MDPADGLAATPDEVRSAVETLTKPQLAKLSLYARARITALWRRAEGRDQDDLLQEALAATLCGKRHWYKGRVDFVGHLIGAMRSIASAWAEKCDQGAPYLESELSTTNEQGEPVNPVSNVSDSTPTVERALDAQHELVTIQALFKNDSNVILVMEGLRDGMTGPEMQAQLGLSEKDYNAALKRMRRILRSKASSGRAV
jgi:hypothetical protein